MVDGIKLEAKSKVYKDRILIPVRNLYEVSKSTVVWDGTKKTITIYKNGTTIKLKSGDKEAYVNNKLHQLDVPVMIENGVSYIPLRFVSESLGAKVNWTKTLVTVTNHKSPIHVNNPQVLKDSYDVVVIGTDPEGIAAAIASAREGQSTLLIDSRSQVGGLFTIGELNSLDNNFSPKPHYRLLTKGIFEEFFKLNNKRTSFDTHQALTVFEEMIVKEPNITILLNAKNIKPVVQGNEITHVSFVNEEGNSKTYSGKQFIDSTQNADFAHAAGEKFTYGQEDYRNVKETMSVTQVFELKNVDWEKIKIALKNDGNSNTGYDAYSAWGFFEMYLYPPKQEDIKMRGLNIGLQNDGNILINALQIMNIDGTNAQEVEEAQRKAKIELPYIVEYMRNHLEGFEKAQLAGTSSELYIRETRHLKGQYRLNINDVLENRDFEDKIAFGGYAVDVQTSETQAGFVVGDPAQYSIPFRAIVPKEMNNLLIASKAASYDSLAHGSARVVPVGMVVGEAAGIASAYANKQNVDFITMATQPGFSHVKKVQAIMNAKGARLEPIPAFENPVMKDWSYEGVKLLRWYGLLAGSYDNDYKLYLNATKKDTNLLIQGLNDRAHLGKTTINYFDNTSEVVNKGELLQFMRNNQVDESKLSAVLMNKIQSANTITRDIMYQFIYEWLGK